MTGRVFGFVRCEKIRNPKVLLPSLNNITIMGSRVAVALAMFDRFHRRINYENDDARDTNGAYKGKSVREEEAPPKTFVPGPACAEYDWNRNRPSAPIKKLIFDGLGAMYPKHCMGRAVLGIAKDMGKLHEIKKTLHCGGYSEVAVSYLGGLTVLITFRDRKEVDEFINNRVELWNECLVSVRLWVGQDIDVDRIALIKVVGMPVCLRDSDSFDKVGRLFGSVVWPSEFSWLSMDNSAGFVYVLTSKLSRIDEIVSVTWKGKDYNIWAVEESSSWVPEFEPSVDTAGDDDFEEGEIRDESVDGVEPEDEVRTDNVDRRDGTGEDERFGDDTANLHGDVNSALIALTPRLGNASVPGTDTVMLMEGGATQTEYGNATTCGPNVQSTPNPNMGQPNNLGNNTTIRKRPRALLTPSSADEISDNNRKLPSVGEPAIGSLFDSTPLTSPAHGQLSVENTEPVSDSFRSVDEPFIEIQDTEQPIEDVDLNQIPANVQLEAEGLNGEIDATVQVGGMVGVNLLNCIGLVANEVILELGSEGSS